MRIQGPGAKCKARPYTRWSDRKQIVSLFLHFMRQKFQLLVVDGAVYVSGELLTVSVGVFGVREVPWARDGWDNIRTIDRVGCGEVTVAMPTMR